MKKLLVLFILLFFLMGCTNSNKNIVGEAFDYIKKDFKIVPQKEIQIPTFQIGKIFPKYWDWRNVHGKNWMTSVKDQYTNNCWAFAEIGAMESQINLFYNQQLNLDLSERMLTDCIESKDHSIGMSGGLFLDCSCDTHLSGREFCVISHHGIVDEGCNPLPDLDEDITKNCAISPGPLCQDWENRLWKNSGYQDFITNNYSYNIPNCAPQEIMIVDEDKIKELLITKGPLAASTSLRDEEFNVQNHNMVLVGYKEEKGWVFKNSWGPEANDNGYITLPFDSVIAISFPLGPFYPPNNKDYWPEGFTRGIHCVDEDNDGYCNWGISENKPSTCPQNCKTKKDCDDSNPNLGPFISEMNFNCLEI